MQLIKKIILIEVLLFFISLKTLLSDTILPCVITEDLTLSKEASPYIVNCNIFVQPNVKISIDKGVTIKFTGKYNFYILGEIKAMGTIDEPIVFEPIHEDSCWGYISINRPTGECEIHNSIFKNGIIIVSKGFCNIIQTKIICNTTTITDDLLFADSADIKIKNCNLVGNGISEGIIIMYSEAPEIENCYVNNTTDSYQYVKCNNGIIRNNISINSKDDGIDHNGCKNTIISGNIIINPKDKGISVGDDNFGRCENIFIDHNLILDAFIGMELKDSSTVKISNNTLFNNQTGIHCFEKVPNAGGGIVELVNTIIYGSNTNILLDEKSHISINFSLADDELFNGEGNLMGDPMFCDTSSRNFHLLLNSPCIDSGDPDSPWDADGTRADIGAFYFNQNTESVVINEINYNSSPDFDSGDWLEIYNSDSIDADLSNWIIVTSDSSFKYTFPAGTQLIKGSYIILNNDTNKLNSVFPYISNKITDRNFHLNDNGDIIKLYNSEGFLEDSVLFGVNLPWPLEAHGKGASLELIDPAYDNNIPGSWSASHNNGTPGKKNSVVLEKEDNYGGDDRIMKLSLFPNPATNYLAIYIKENNFLNMAIKFFNYLGNEINCSFFLYEINEDEKLIIVNTSDLMNGKYLVKVTGNGFHQIGQFIIHK